MAEANISKTVAPFPPSGARKSAGMLDEIKTIRQAIENGASGFLFAAVMPDGDLFWFAAGDLDDYGTKTSSIAMRLYHKALRFAFPQAADDSTPSSATM